jgi:stage III sporulation protein AB
MAKRYQMEEENLQQLERLLLWMQNELRCRCPELCTLLRLAAERSIGDIQKIFIIFSEQIAERELTDLSAALLPVLQRHADIGKSVHQVLQELVKSLGEFDLQGQMEQLRAVQALCQLLLQQHRMERDGKIRCYKTVGICAGVALAVILL